MMQFPPFGGALDVGRAQPCATHNAIAPVWWWWGRGSGRWGRGSGWWGRGSGWRGAQSADHLGEKRRQWAVAGEVVCDVGTTAPGLVCRSHANRWICAGPPIF